MSPRLAWLAPVITGALVAVLLPLSWATAEHDGAEVPFGLAFMAYATVGALIASRHPRNPVGWLFAGLGLMSALTETLYTYAARAAQESAQPGDAATAAAWVSGWAGGPAFVGLVLLLLVFPDGRFLSRRWRVLGMGATGLAVVWSLALALRPGPLYVSAIRNPVGLDAAGGVLRAVVELASLGFFLLVPVAVASVVVRHRASGPVERQQIKWLAIGGGFAIVTMAVSAFLQFFVDTDEGTGDLVTALLVCSAVVAFPVAAGVAILRHRLYDIDVVIKRTLVYGSLTALLVSAYLGVVLVFRLALGPIAGESDLAVAASTLAVAGLFRPLRDRLQSAVDRQFYRQRYDAARTLAAFGSQLRHEIDLEALGDDLRRVVQDTVQPAHVSLWLREVPR